MIYIQNAYLRILALFSWPMYVRLNGQVWICFYSICSNQSLYVQLQLHLPHQLRYEIIAVLCILVGGTVQALMPLYFTLSGVSSPQRHLNCYNSYFSSNSYSLPNICESECNRESLLKVVCVWYACGIRFHWVVYGLSTYPLAQSSRNHLLVAKYKPHLHRASIIAKYLPGSEDIAYGDSGYHPPRP